MGVQLKRWVWRIGRVAGILVAIAMATGVFAATGYAIAPHSEEVLTPISRERLTVEFNLEPGAQRTEVFDSRGVQMGVLNTGVSDREIIPYEQIPTDVIEAITAVEDENFFDHNGWDFRGTLRALMSNVASDGISQGGSTITQQIVKLRVVGSERTLNRKIREAVLASRLEEELSKEELLEFYLNEIYFGNGAYGIQAAAETYFGKDAQELDHGDAALLAGLVRSPSIFDGFDDIDIAQRRREVGLIRLLDQGHITQEEFDEYQRRPLPTRNLSPRFTDDSLRRNYFLDEVVSSALDLEILGETRDDRFNAVYAGGLRIYSTYDPSMEQMMRESVDEFFADKDQGQFEVSIATVEPSTGAIRAFIGGPDFADFEFNLATQGKRQPGSSFKTYVLTTAIERAGFLPYDTISGVGPCVFDDGAQGFYTVNNFGGGRGSAGTLAGMTRASSNCAYVRLGILADLEDVVDVASRMIGRTGEDRFLPFKSMSLGAQEVTPLEQAVGYSVLANGGVRMEPYYIERIEDRNGEVIYQHVPRGERVLSEDTAAWVSNVLETNVRFGTGTRAQLANGQPAAGKTGTAQDFGDAWFVGFTPYYSTAVWVGDPTEVVEMRNIWGLGGVTGGRVPAPIFGSFMSKVHEALAIQEFPADPPAPRSSRFLHLPDEKCTVEIELDDGATYEFELDCTDVRVDLGIRNGTFIPRDDALCEIEVQDPDGLVRREKVRCVDVVTRINTTTTTEEETTTTSEGEGGEGGEGGDGGDGDTTTTSEGGGASSTTTEGGGSSTSTTTTSSSSTTTTTGNTTTTTSGDTTTTTGATTSTTAATTSTTAASTTTTTAAATTTTAGG